MLGRSILTSSSGLAEMLILVVAEFLIIITAICKGGSFIFKLQPREIMTTLS